MLQYFWLLPLGVFVGMFDTLIRAGGGLVLTPLLLVTYPSERPEIITRIALAVLFANALPGSVMHARLKRIDYRSGVFSAFIIMPVAVISALLTTSMSRSLLELLSGLVLLLIAACLLARQHLQHTWQRMIPQQRLWRLMQSEGTLHFTLAVLALAGILVHLLTGTWHHGLRRAIVLGIGMCCGAQLGIHFSPYLHGTLIVRHVAIALGGGGIWLLLLAYS